MGEKSEGERDKRDMGVIETRKEEEGLRNCVVVLVVNDGEVRWGEWRWRLRGIGGWKRDKCLCWKSQWV